MSDIGTAAKMSICKKAVVGGRRKPRIFAPIIGDYKTVTLLKFT
jgi:hypothetical protein